MKEIKTDRFRGYLNLDSYFIKKLGREFIDLEDLFINGLIDYEPDGISEKFWILSPSGDRVALYKSEIPGSYESYVELLVEEVAKVMQIPAAHYDLAMFNGGKGVISYNYLKNNSVDYSGFDVISEFYEKNLQDDKELSSLYNIDYVNDSIDDVCDKLNNLQDIWCILEERFANAPNKREIVKSIMDGLVDKLMLDVITVAIDSHTDNWKIVDDKYSSPVFDNSRSLGIFTKYKKTQVNEDKKFEDSEMLLTVDNENINKPLEVLEYFLKISSSEYKERFIEKLNNVKENIDVIPTRIEERTNASMPEHLKNHFITNMNEYLEKVSQIANDKGTIK